jgi:two-component system chemotaxis response regulator CheY
MQTILVVDDSATMRQSLQNTLEMSGYVVVLAPEGQSALAHLQSGLRPDLIITDINMPCMDGISFIGEARKLLRFTPILALTTRDQQAKRELAKHIGATGWLIKPVGGSELIRLIRPLLPPRDAGGAPPG